MSGLTQELLKELLNYNPETGLFVWRVARGRQAAGSVAGTPHNEGYVVLKVLKKLYLAHRLAFLWVTGAWPEHEVDHINGIRTDNRWCNLRDITHSENCHNLGGPVAHNTTGYAGVMFDTRSGRFRVEIKLHGKSHHVGFFESPVVAHLAYLEAKGKFHPTHKRMING